MRRAQLRVGEAAHGALGDPGPPKQPSAAGAVRPARIGFGGYITCTLEPWSVMGSVGRISTWPESVEMFGREIAASLVRRAAHDLAVHSHAAAYGHHACRSKTAWRGTRCGVQADAFVVCVSRKTHVWMHGSVCACGCTCVRCDGVDARVGCVGVWLCILGVRELV